MSSNIRRVSNVIGQTFAVFGAATSAAAAVRNHRRPSDSALRTLGIDPAIFPSDRRL